MSGAGHVPCTAEIRTGPVHDGGFVPRFFDSNVMEFQVWLAFFAASWVIAISPGSGAVLSMSHGLAYGVRHTSATIAGLQLGLSVILLIAGVDRKSVV